MESFRPPVATSATSDTPAWTSPGDAVDAPRFRSAPTIFEEPDRRTDALVASPLARLQPRTVGQLLDGGFEVLRFRFRTIAVVAATVVLPLYAVPQVLVAALSGLGDMSSFDMTSSPLVTPSGEVSGDFWTAIGFSYLARLGLMLATMVMGVAVTHLVSAWLVGRDPSATDTLRFVRVKLPTIVVAFALAMVIKVVAAIPCGLGLVYVLPALSVLAPVIAAEGASATEAIGRSFKLVRRRFGPVLGVTVLWWAASALMSTAASAAAAAVGGLATNSAAGVQWGVQSMNVVATVVLTVVLASVTALVYIDLRVRTEGLDLELESAKRFDVPPR